MATVAIATLTLAACGDDGGGSSDTTAATAEDGGGDLSSYEDVASIAEDLNAAGITCDLEYEGLEDESRETSLCTIEGTPAQLSVWKDEALLEEFVGSDPPPAAVAYGANWSVELGTPAAAADVAEATGGTTTDG